jgi:hypothetical protein
VRSSELTLFNQDSGLAVSGTLLRLRSCYCSYMDSQPVGIARKNVVPLADESQVCVDGGNESNVLEIRYSGIFQIRSSLRISRFCAISIVLFLSRTPSCFYLKGRFGDWTFLQAEIGTSSIDWAQLSGVYLKTKTESSLRNVLLDKNMTVF